MDLSSNSKCSHCDCVVSSRKQFCRCLVCKVPLHRACCGIVFARGGTLTWKEYSSNYRCTKCVEGVGRETLADDADPVSLKFYLVIFSKRNLLELCPYFTNGHL
jgi:hypothetical protein